MIYIIAAILLISILLIFFIAINNNFKILLIKINEAFISCTGSLDKKNNIVNELLNNFDNKVKEETDKIKEEIAVHNDIFDLYEKLEKASFDLNQILESHSGYDNNLKITELLIDLSDIDEELEADNNYYNDNVIIFNIKVKTFPSNIVASIKKYKEKPKFEKIKREKYEILKEDI